MTTAERQLTSACVQWAEKHGKQFGRRVRIVKGSRKYCPKSYSDIFARRHAPHTRDPRTGLKLKPVIYVHQSCWTRVIEQSSEDIQPLLDLIARIVEVAYDVDHYPYIACAIGRNVEKGSVS